MFNIAVVNIKDILKYLVSITITLCIVMLFTRYFSSLKEEPNSDINKKFSGIMQRTLLICLDETIPAIKETNYELNNIEEDEINKKTILGTLLKVELAMFAEKEKSKEVNNEAFNESINTSENETEVLVESIPENTQTEVVTENPLGNNYTIECNGVKIKNETSYELTQEMLSERIAVNSNNIIIFHTHTCESYTSSDKYQYTPTGNYRTTDNNFSVVRVGKELLNYLLQYGYNVIHNTTYHDYPAYSRLI